jgi:hypothetical protein
MSQSWKEKRPFYTLLKFTQNIIHYPKAKAPNLLLRLCVSYRKTEEKKTGSDLKGYYFLLTSAAI